MGSPGQANYAAANAFVEAATAQRRSLGLPGTSFAWGMWESERGMRGQVGDADVNRLRRSGFRPIGSEEAMAAFDAGIASADAVLVPLPVDRTVLRSLAGNGGLPPLLRGLTEVVASGGDSAATLTERLAGLSAHDRTRAVTDLVKDHVAAVLGQSSPDAVDAGTVFFDMGFDSLSAVELRNRLNAATGLMLPATLLFDHPDVTALAEAVRDQLFPVAEEPGSAPDGSSIAAMSAEQLIDLALRQGDR